MDRTVVNGPGSDHARKGDSPGLDLQNRGRREVQIIGLDIIRARVAVLQRHSSRHGPNSSLFSSTKSQAEEPTLICLTDMNRWFAASSRSTFRL